jgi:hypothetical protein
LTGGYDLNPESWTKNFRGFLWDQDFVHERNLSDQFRRVKAQNEIVDEDFAQLLGDEDIFVSGLFEVRLEGL